MAETLCGSPLYMAPEILKFQKYDAKADLWSVGTILYEMVVGKPPYGGANHVQLLANIERQDLRFPSQIEVSAPCRRLLTGLLQRKPASRMGFDEFFSDPFVGLPPSESSAEEQGFLPGNSGSSIGAHRSSLSSLPPADSIREEEEEEEDEESKGSSSATERTGVMDGAELRLPPKRSTSAGSDQSPVVASGRRARAFSVSHDQPTPGASLRNSRSGNMEVMQTTFGSTSSAGIAGLRRSSRLGRSRRATSSGSMLTNETSPKLSPQMSPSALPSPTPRINPFKQLSESPPGAHALLHASAHHQHPFRSSFSSSSPYSPSKPTKYPVRQKAGLDTDGEYVLVESGTEKGPRPVDDAVPSAFVRPPAPQDAVAKPAASTVGASSARQSALPQFSHEHGQQVIDIVLLRTQAIAPIAEQLWKLSDAQSQLQRESLTPSAANLDSVFSMSSSLSSSAGGNALVEFSKSLTGEGEIGESVLASKKQYVFAAEALALYVKCLRLIQHGVLYLRQDPALKRLPSSSPNAATVPMWSEASRKLSMAYLMEQLNVFLDRADQCKSNMASALSSCRDPATVRELQGLVVSQEELMYSHAIRLGKQGAIKEVLGQSRGAYDHYLQAMLLLESLLLDAAPSSTPVVSGAMATEDQTRVTTFLRALEDRLRNVKASDEGEKKEPAMAMGAMRTPGAMIRAAGP